MTEKEWDLLLLTLERQSCVLLLGTESLPATHALSASRFAAHLAAEMERPDLATRELAHVAERYENNERFGRPDLEYELGRFYQQPADIPSLFTGIAALPFHLTVTTCHDDLLLRAFVARGKSPIAEAYNYKGGTCDLVQMGTGDAPLVYSLYGSPKRPGSLVVTETDLLDFLVRVITGNPGLPRNIRSELQKNVSFLFVGFGMHQWYLRILLHVLEFSRKKKAFALEPLRVENSTTGSVVFFYAGYSIDVISCELDGFVTELTERYESHQKVSRNRVQANVIAMPPQPAPRVFICYASEDREAAERIYRTLGAELDVWMDRDMTGGEAWNRTIQDQLNDSDYCVVLHSAKLAGKNFSYVNKEISLALDRQKYARTGVRFLIPAQIDETPLMADIKDLQAVRVFTDQDASGLISTIKRDFQRRNRG